MKQIITNSAILVVVFLAGALGFVAGRITAPTPSVDLIWTEAPGALTIAWSMDEDEAIEVWFDGGRDSKLRPDDGAKYERLAAMLDSAPGLAGVYWFSVNWTHPVLDLVC